MRFQKKMFLFGLSENYVVFGDLATFSSDPRYVEFISQQDNLYKRRNCIVNVGFCSYKLSKISQSRQKLYILAIW